MRSAICHDRRDKRPSKRFRPATCRGRHLDIQANKASFRGRIQTPCGSRPKRPMRISNDNYDKYALCLAFLLLSAAGQAEVYKWVDANGQTHFSERKDDAGKAKVLELKEDFQPTSTRASKSTSQYWQEQEILFKQRQMQNPKKPSGPPIINKPKSLSGGRSDDTDASRCNLARDVISGAVRHPNGAPTDKYDLEVAQNDVRSYCH